MVILIKKNRCRFQKALHFYGINNFSWEIIDIAENYYDLCCLEDKYVERYSSYNVELGYNTMRSGHIHSPETRDKISKSLKLIDHPKLGPEFGEKIRQAKLGVKRSPETIEKMRQSHLGVKRGPHSEEHRAKIGNGRRGKKHSPESIEKMRVVHRDISDETRLKMSQSQKGRIPWNKGLKGVSEETRLKLSNAAKGRVMSEESKIKSSIANKNRKRTAEEIEKSRIARTGAKRSQEACDNIRKGTPVKRGEEHGMFGKKHSEETRRKISENTKIGMLRKKLEMSQVDVGVTKP